MTSLDEHAEWKRSLLAEIVQRPGESADEALARLELERPESDRSRRQAKAANDAGFVYRQRVELEALRHRPRTKFSPMEQRLGNARQALAVSEMNALESGDISKGLAA